MWFFVVIIVVGIVVWSVKAANKAQAVKQPFSPSVHSPSNPFEFSWKCTSCGSTTIPDITDEYQFRCNACGHLQDMDEKLTAEKKVKRIQRPFPAAPVDVTSNVKEFHIVEESTILEKPVPLAQQPIHTPTNPQIYQKPAPAEPAQPTEAGAVEALIRASLIETIKSQPDQLDAVELSLRLFRGDAFSTAVEEQFAPIEGQKVRWTGTLLNVHPFTYDFVFGTEPGLRAEIQIAELEGQMGLTTKVLAVVQFSSVFKEKLDSCLHQVISFSGDLHMAKGVSKEIYLKEGLLEHA